MDINAYWDRVNVLIKAHKISKENFADFIDIPRSTFYAWKRYRRAPELGIAYNIATALGVSVEYLVTGNGGENGQIPIEETEQRKIFLEKVKHLTQELQNEVVNI